MAQEFLEHHVRLAYRALRHKGYATLCHAQNMQTAQVADRRLVANENDLVTWAKSWNGKANIFVGRNPRVLGDDKTLAGITSFSVDIDPIRPKGSASSLVQVAKAVSCGRRLLSSYRGGAIFESGNGCQVLYTWPPYRPEVYKDFGVKSKAFKDQLVNLLRSEGLEIDHVHEPERLMKLPGTLSTKGDRKDWRVARFLDDEDTFKDGSSVLRAILSQGVSQAPLAAPTAEELGVKSKSEAQFAMAAFLKAKGYKAEQVLAALRNSPYGKQNRDDDNVRIVQKVFAGVATVQGGQVVEKEVKVYTFQEAKDEAARRKAERGDGRAPEMPLGIKGLDAILWGLRRGNMATIGARTGVGKTALALHITKTVAELGKRVLFFSTEMPVDEIVERLGVAGTTPECDIRICDLSSPSVEAIQAAIGGSKPDLLVLDFIQHTAGGGGDSRYRELSKFVVDFHDLLKEHNCAGLVLSQLSRVAATQPPELEHLKECGTIEEESSAVLLMHRLDSNPDLKEIPVMINVKKHRHGAMGSVTAMFQPEKMTFKEIL